MESKSEIRPPKSVWRLAVLFLATSTLYQVVWLYRTADDLKRSRGVALTPWHWSVVPLLGPLAAIPVYYLASQLKSWQVEEGREIGHLSEPVLVAMMVIWAYLPFLLMIASTDVLSTVLVIAALLLCPPYLALQAQLNINKGGKAAHGKPWRFSRHEVIATIGGLFLAAPLYVYTFTDAWVRHGSSAAAAGKVVTAEKAFFQVRIGDADWTQVKTGHLSGDSDLEFLGPDRWTWAIVYDSTGIDVDSVMSYRIRNLKKDYRGISCRQVKSLLPHGMIVHGDIECTGRNMIEGSYIFVSRVLSDGTQAVEMVVGTSQKDPKLYEQAALRARAFADGLEFVQ